MYRLVVREFTGGDVGRRSAGRIAGAQRHLAGAALAGTTRPSLIGHNKRRDRQLDCAKFATFAKMF